MVHQFIDIYQSLMLTSQPEQIRQPMCSHRDLSILSCVLRHRLRPHVSASCARVDEARYRNFLARRIMRTIGYVDVLVYRYQILKIRCGQTC